MITPQTAPVTASCAISGPRSGAGACSVSIAVKSATERVMRPIIAGPTSNRSMNAIRSSAWCATRCATNASIELQTASSQLSAASIAGRTQSSVSATNSSSTARKHSSLLRNCWWKASVETPANWAICGSVSAA